MNCYKMENRLDDYLDNHLSDKERERFENHLQVCESCRGKLDNAKAMMSRLTGLTKEISPENDLWNNISARIADEKGRKTPKYRTGDIFYRVGKQYLSIAAAMIIVIAVVFGLYRGKTGRKADSFTFHDYSRTIVESEYQFALSEVIKHFDYREIDFPEKILDDLKIIENHIKEVRTALGEYPESVELLKLLSNLYQSEVNLLQKISSLNV